MELGAIGLAIVGAMIISIGSSGNGSGNNSKNKEWMLWLSFTKLRL